jgi:hypothetical protein
MTSCSECCSWPADVNVPWGDCNCVLIYITVLHAVASSLQVHFPSACRACAPFAARQLR